MDLGFRGSVYDFLVSRVKKYLHIILIFDNASLELQRCFESNPALYTRCEVQWIDTWSSESMMILAYQSFAKSNALSQMTDKDFVIGELLAIHQSFLSQGATPKHFMEYLAMYEIVYASKKESLVKKQNYLEGGLKKLNEASAYVDKLSKEAMKQKIELADKQMQADAALKEITDRMVQASEQKKEIEVLNTNLKDEESKMVLRKQEVEGQLAEVEPIIKVAKAAVGEIRSESLTEIRSLRAPPPAIRDVLEGVLRLMGNLDMSWNSMKGFLGQRAVKEEIMNFDVRRISKQTREAVQQLLLDKKDSFEESVIKRSSIAAAPLALWVKANIQYASVIEKVAPMEKELNTLKSNLENSKKRVQQIEQELGQLDAKVEELRERFSSQTKDAEILRSSLEKALEVIQGSQELLEKLWGEGGRWEAQAKDIQVSISSLPRYTLLSAAFIIYLPNAPEGVRKEKISQWSQITKIDKSFNFCSFMSSESEQLVRKSQGLPSDALSNENAVILLNSNSVPLIIDPSGQATEWLSTHLSGENPEVINYRDEGFMRSLELAGIIIVHLSSVRKNSYCKWCIFCRPSFDSIHKKRIHKNRPTANTEYWRKIC